MRIPRRRREKDTSSGIYLFSLSLAFAFYLMYEPSVTLSDGVMVKNEPHQETLLETYSFPFGEYQITVLAKFRMEGKVLSKERYRFDQKSDIVPYDLALGWKRMSDERVLSNIDISQSGRWYIFQTNEKTLLDKEEIAKSSANMHMIPSNVSTRKTLDEVKKGHIISLEGRLVSIKDKQGGVIVSSLSRSDTGGGSCEVVLLDKFSIKDTQ